MRLVLFQSSRPVLVDITVGLLLSLVTARFLTSLIFGRSPYDPLLLTTVSLLLSFVALAAIFIPARLAAQVDPMEALRCE